jgi:hypothetical protein
MDYPDPSADRQIVSIQVDARSHVVSPSFPSNSAAQVHSNTLTPRSIWAIASWFLGSYIVVQRLSIPLQIQPQLFGSLAAVSVAQCLYYDKGWSKLRAVLFFITFEVLFAGFEAGSVFALWVGTVVQFQHRHQAAPALFTAE